MPANGRSSARSLRSAPSPTPRRATGGSRPDRRRHGGGGEILLAATTRAERRKRRTRERLLDAALAVFLQRGYDGATTAEMARTADLGAGTFYCHFRDKRAAFEGIAQRTSQTILERWTSTIPRGTSVADGVALALDIVARYWREQPARARLLLEGGPSFGTAAHLRLIEEFAAVLRTRFTGPSGRRLTMLEARTLGALVVGLAIEIGRLVLGSSGSAGHTTVARLIRLARLASSTLGRLDRRKGGCNGR